MGVLHSAGTCLFDDVRTVHHHTFGNIKNQLLSEVWNSDAYVSFRENVKAFMYSP